MVLALRNDAEDVVLADDQVIDAVDLNLGARILAKEDTIVRLNLQRSEVSVVQRLAGANSDHDALSGLLLSGVGNVE